MSATITQIGNYSGAAPSYDGVSTLAFLNMTGEMMVGSTIVIAVCIPQGTTVADTIASITDDVHNPYALIEESTFGGMLFALFAAQNIQHAGTSISIGLYGDNVIDTGANTFYVAATAFSVSGLPKQHCARYERDRSRRHQHSGFSRIPENSGELIFGLTAFLGAYYPSITAQGPGGWGEIPALVTVSDTSQTFTAGVVGYSTIDATQERVSYDSGFLYDGNSIDANYASFIVHFCNITNSAVTRAARTYHSGNHRSTRLLGTVATRLHRRCRDDFTRQSIAVLVRMGR